MADGFGKYDVYTVAGSNYCYTGTNVLKNRFGIRDNERLKALETDITAVRQNDLLLSPLPGRFTKHHLCRIHQYLFGDLYFFAGHFRREDIMKGTTRFLSHREIPQKLDDLLSELHRDQILRGCSAETLVAKSAYYLAELNYIHPFREGNGRTIREFMRLIYLQAGYLVDWGAVPPEVLLDAMIESVFLRDRLDLVLWDCLTPLHE